MPTINENFTEEQLNLISSGTDDSVTFDIDQELYNKSDPLSNGIMTKWLALNGYEHIESKEDLNKTVILLVKGSTLTGEWHWITIPTYSL